MIVTLRFLHYLLRFAWRNLKLHPSNVLKSIFLERCNNVWTLGRNTRLTFRLLWSSWHAWFSKSMLSAEMLWSIHFAWRWAFIHLQNINADRSIKEASFLKCMTGCLWNVAFLKNTHKLQLERTIGFTLAGEANFSSLQWWTWRDVCKQVSLDVKGASSAAW